MKRFFLYSLLAAASLGYAADIPPASIGYQGSLASVSALYPTTFGGPIELRFYLFQTETSEEAIWGRVLNVTTDAEGNFVTTLSDAAGTAPKGETFPLLAKVLAGQDTEKPLYITFSAGANSTLLAPRQAIYTVPKAHLANTAQVGLDGFSVSGVLQALSVKVADTTTLTTALEVKTLTVSDTETTTLQKDLNADVPASLTDGKLTVDGTLTFGENVTGGNLFPIGTIIMWSGSNATIPAGWRFCDGTEGTPDLRTYFIVGEKSSDSNFSAVGKTGGAESVSLSSSMLPKHNHAFSHIARTHIYAPRIGASGVFLSRNDDNDGEDSWCMGEASETSSNRYYTGWDSVGSNADNYPKDKPHNNLPQYYALCFIQRVL